MLDIKSIPAFNDNYIWLIENSDRRCIVVDPGDAEPVIDYLDAHELTLEAILVTHHHNDHTGGIAKLKARDTSLTVFGPMQSVKAIDISLAHGDEFTCLGQTFAVLGLPGHTLDHIGYVTDQHLFCGDVLFSGGCGRVFEGTMEQMHTSLTRIASLPDETLIYPAHEYTLANLKFALAVEPKNLALQEYWQQCQTLRAESKPTLPTSLKKEKAINPFIRCDSAEIISSTQARGNNSTAPLAVFTSLREWKNEF